MKIVLPAEEADEPAFTRHLILKRPQASWSQSVFSVPLGEKIVPNRDYPYEGLSVLIQGENYHFLDAIAVGVKTGDRYLSLRPKTVTASPWVFSYHYEAEDREGVALSVTYYLMDIGDYPNGITACLEIRSVVSPVYIEPILDIRHMYDRSEPEAHTCMALDDGLLVQRDDKYIAIRTPGCNYTEVSTWRRRELEWWYKLGSGFRENQHGSVVFRGESRNLVSMGEIIVHSRTVQLVIACAGSYTQLEQLHDRGRYWRVQIAEEERNAVDMFEPGRVALRTLALSRFGMLVNGHFLYEAGDLWFRTPWFRDQFEGIINNIETLFRIGHAHRVRSIILHSFDYQDDYGRIPNRFPERANAPLDYNNADAILLAFIAAGEYLIRKSDDERMRSAILTRAEFTINRFATNEPELIDGAPVLCDDSLLTVVPWHSWIDTRRVNGISRRIPDSWCEDDIGAIGAQNDYNKPKYRLPEINAQWIKMLSHCMKQSKGDDTEERYRALRANACKSFKEVFWNAEAGNIYNIVAPDGKKDGTWGSPAVVAVAMLLDEHVFTENEVDLFVSGIKKHLLMYNKDGLPFGILVKESSKRVYFGDEEYHEAMVWPRDTPYLIKILRYAGEVELVQGILRSNLKHQMDEGFVFYKSFSARMAIH